MNKQIEFKNINGQNIPYREGNSLCSVRDPVREANQWYLNQKWDFRTDYIIILGIGAAAHLQILQEKAPSKIIAIDFNRELVENARHLLEKSVDLVHIESVQEFKSHKLIQQFVTLDAQILSFRPAWQNAENEFSSLRNLLVGSDEESKEWQESLFDKNEIKMLSDTLRSLS